MPPVIASISTWPWPPLILGLIVGGLLFWIAISALREWIQIVRLRRVGPYTEGRAGYWRHTSVNSYFATHTISGFRVAYKLSAILKRVDNEQFQAARMLDPGNDELPLAVFNKRFLEPLLYPTGPHFFTFGWHRNPSPGVLVFAISTKDGVTTQEFDPNGCGLFDAANASATKAQWKSHGCCIEQPLRIEKIADHFIEENYKMIAPHEHLLAEKDLMVLRMQEVAVIKALKLRHDLAQPIKSHRGTYVTVKTSVVSTVVAISWELGEEATKTNSRLWGFRREGSFSSEDQFDASGANGIPIVDSPISDSCTDHPTPGQTHYYTFVLRRRTKDGSYMYYDLLRFSVHVPQENDLAKLQKLLDQSRTGSEAEHTERAKRIAVLEKVDFAVARTELLINLKKLKIEQVNANAHYSAAEKVELIKAIEDEIKEATFHFTQ